ncbi:MAG: hypothetical protein WCZ86_06130 [Desulfurivibrionaceae bacterium]
MASDPKLILTNPTPEAIQAAASINRLLESGELVRLTDYCRTAKRSRQYVHRLTIAGALPSLKIGTVTYLAVK